MMKTLNQQQSVGTDNTDVMEVARSQGYAASSYAECPYISGQKVLCAWDEGYIAKCIETAVISSDTPLFVLGQIAFLQGRDITQMPEGEMMSGRWVLGWLMQRDAARRPGTPNNEQKGTVMKLADLKQQVAQAKTKAELCVISENADAMFMADKQQLHMSDQDWIEFTNLLTDRLTEINDQQPGEENPSVIVA